MSRIPTIPLPPKQWQRHRWADQRGPRKVAAVLECAGLRLDILPVAQRERRGQGRISQADCVTGL